MSSMERPYAVVSCHVERPLDDRCWRLFSRLQERRPGGFVIAALMRPAERAAGEDGERWLERAREAAARAPLGHHTHFGGPGQARPRADDDDPVERVRSEAAWLREVGLAPRLFCGGGWYMDDVLARTLAGLGYVDCTATPFRPSYLAVDAKRIAVGRPVWLTIDGARLLELPTTHSLGMIAKGMLDPKPLPPLVHVYFHDTDLLSRTTRAALVAALAVLCRRRRPIDLEQLADEAAREAPDRPFSEASRP
jgi:hypothetical protein